MGEPPGVRRRVVWDRADAIGAAWHNFWLRSRKGRAWKGCEACPPERRNPDEPVSSHHVIGQQRLKRLVRDRGWTKLRQIELLTDERNAMLVCDRCHSGHTSHMHPIAREAITEDAWAFAAELQLTHEVMDEYPRRDT